MKREREEGLGDDMKKCKSYYKGVCERVEKSIIFIVILV